MRVMGIAVRAAAVACMALSLSGGAWAQIQPLGASDDELTKATSEIDAMAKTAREAAAADNCVRKNIYTNRIWAIYRDEKNPFWRRHHFESLARTTSTGLAQLETHMRDVVEQLNQLPCPRVAVTPRQPVESHLVRIELRSAEPILFPQSPAGQNKFEASATGGLVVANLPTRGFLARELIGSGVQELDQVAPTRRASGSDFNAAFNYHFGSSGSHSFQIKIGHSQLSASETGGSYDPGAGHLLLIPGPNGGASGLSLPANPLNIVRNIDYKSEISAWDVAFGYAGEVARFRFGGNGTARVEGVVGVGGRWGDYDETFSGQIPGFARNFGYSSNINVNSARGIFGTNVVWSVPSSGIPIEIKTGFTISPMLLRASGTDSLSFTGFPTSSQDLSKNKTDVGYGVTGEVNFGVPRTNKLSVIDRIGIKASYESQPGFPVVERDGTNPSNIALQRFNIFSASLQLLGVF